MNRHIDPLTSSDADHISQEVAKLERESKLVKKVRPMLSQKSFSLERLHIVNVSNSFTKHEKDRCLKIIDLEEAKIKAYLNLQEAKRQELDSQAE